MHNKRKKVTRKRGSETHGHGASKKWRGAGHKGGRGNAGSGKRGDSKIMKVTKGNKNYLGKHGFTSKNIDTIKTINLFTIQKQMDSLLSKKLIKQEGDTYIIDLGSIGFNKLLSKGNVTKKLNITVDFATGNAIEKVAKAGGIVMIKVQEKTESAVEPDAAKIEE
ncbi:MAG: 50S ribosomal protein L15 [Nanoarchaeota archaeon]|nr:50S ribosomal protein L15 [Nanoarchaeota archaeon]